MLTIHFSWNVSIRLRRKLISNLPWARRNLFSNMQNGQLFGAKWESSQMLPCYIKYKVWLKHFQLNWNSFKAFHEQSFQMIRFKTIFPFRWKKNVEKKKKRNRTSNHFVKSRSRKTLIFTSNYMKCTRLLLTAMVFLVKVFAKANSHFNSTFATNL